MNCLKTEGTSPMSPPESAGMSSAIRESMSMSLGEGARI